MTLLELQRKFEKSAQVLTNQGLNMVERTALDTKALIQRRVIESGTNSKGVAFAPYSPAYLQFKIDVGRYRGHPDAQLGNYSIAKRIQAVQARKRKKKRADALTRPEQKVLTQFRARQRPASGATLWNSIGVIEKVNKGFLLEVSIGPRDELNRKKATSWAKKRGNLLLPTTKEAQQAQEGYSKGMAKLITNEFK